MGRRGPIFSLVAALVLLGSIAAAEANQACVQQCRAADNQCRLATKGSPACDAQLQACMNRCRGGR
jgi:hypothetical protein